MRQLNFRSAPAKVSAAVGPGAGSGSADSPIIETRAVTKAFHVKGKSNLALSNVDLSVARGEFVSLVGPSGCGKTTLLRMLACLASPDSGGVYFEGTPLTAISRDMAFVFQDIALFPWRTVRKNVEMGLEARGLSASDRREAALDALDLVGLRDRADVPPYTLSGGMQQRVGIARALVTRPKVLLMDEPFGHLDNFTREALQIEVEKLWSQIRMTVVFVTHDIDEAIFLSDRIALFHSSPGRISEVVDVPLERPRWERNVRSDPRGAELRDYIVRQLDVRSSPTL